MIKPKGRAVISPAPPSGPPQAVAKARARFDAAGFNAAAVRAALHADTELLSSAGDIATHDRRLADVPVPLATLVRLFVLDLPVALDEGEAALTSAAVDDLVQLGLVAETTEGRLAAAARIVPHDDLLVASDCVRSTGADHVAAVHRPSATLASLTMRRPVATALDVGTGNGIQALLAARHSGTVVATDVSERALAFAEFNAALNGCSNIEVRAGSFFEPVDGERFELVVCNPPYVISPETEHIFRDSGMPGDTVSEQVIAELPAHLADGGFATAMLSWIASEDATERPRSWLAGSGCDAWLIHTATEDPLTAAAAWNRANADRSPERLDAWLTYYAELGIDAIAYGAAILHRQSSGDGWVRTAELPANRLWPASAHLERLFAAHELLAGDVLALPLALVPGAFVDRTDRLDSGRWAYAGATVRLESGIGFGINLDRYGSALVALVDGAAPVRDRLGPLAVELELSAQDLEAFAAQLVGHLVERGFVEPV